MIFKPQKTQTSFFLSGRELKKIQVSELTILRRTMFIRFSICQSFIETTLFCVTQTVPNKTYSFL